MSKYDRVMKKVNKFYLNPKKEELYNLDSSIIDYLIPRLDQFMTDSIEHIDWSFHKEHDNVDVIETIKAIIVDLIYIRDNKYEFDANIAKECLKRSKRVFNKLDKIFFYLWW